MTEEPHKPSRSAFLSPYIKKLLSVPNISRWYAQKLAPDVYEIRGITENNCIHATFRMTGEDAEKVAKHANILIRKRRSDP